MATKVRYILEARYADSSEKFVLPYVGKIDFTRRHAKKTTWTVGRIPFHQYSGIRSQTFHMSGRSGLAERFDSPGYFDFSNVSSDMSGPALFRKLEKFLEKYETKCFEAQQSRSELPKLVLKALWEDKNLYVELENFSWVRDKSSSRLSYEWDLELHSYADAGKIEPSGPQAWLSGATEIADKVTEAVNYANVAVASVSDILSDTRTELDKFRQPMRAIANLGRQGRLAARQLGQLGQFPVDFMRDFWYAVYEMTAVMFDIWMALPYADRNAARLSLLDIMESVGDARRATFAALGLNYESVPEYTWSPEKLQGFLDSSDYRLNSRNSALTQQKTLGSSYVIKNNQLVQVYTVKSGETLQDIAQAILGDKSAWVDIAELNEMVSPFTLNDGSPLVNGSIVLVPIPGNSPSIGGVSPTDLYGTDLQLDSSGDLILSGTAGVSSSDIKVISGNANFTQAIKLRMLTFRGTNGTFPDYGVPNIIGEKGTDDRIADAAIEIKAQLFAEKRIQEIDDLVVTDNGDEITVRANVKPVIGQKFSLNVPIPTGG